MPIGTVWQDDTWSDDAWEDGTWADAEEGGTPPTVPSSRTWLAPERDTQWQAPARDTQWEES